MIAESPMLNVQNRRVPRPDVDPVDDVAEADPIQHVAERAAEQQPERHRDEQVAARPGVVPDDQADHDDAGHGQDRAPSFRTTRTARRRSANG